MKICRFDAGEGPRLGIVKGDSVIDVVAHGATYNTIEAVIAGGEAALTELARITENAASGLALDQLRLLAPLPRPGKYLAIGMNFRKHVEEAEKLGVEAPKKQFWFNKQTTCVAGPFDDIDPGVSEKVDWEVELGVIIGKRAKRVTAANALSHIFGYVVANDVSARDWQFHSPTFTIGKSFDTHGPIGPWIVTADEIADPQKLDLRCTVNGKIRQDNNTSNMIHTIAEQIEYLSTAFTLEPGDLLATGTPEGVGIGMDPQVFLKTGDVVRCEIEHIGAIENKVIAA